MPEKTEKAKTSFALDKELYRRAQHYSLDAELDVTKLFELSVAEYMKNHPVKPK